MSQAQSASNLMFQRSQDIDRDLKGINNCSKSIFIHPNTHELSKGKKLPSNVIDLIKEKGLLAACQGFLMEVVKFKQKALELLQRSSYQSENKEPDEPRFEGPKMERLVEESWGWEQLSDDERAEYIEVEAKASHIGQFIHKQGVLDRLRTELPLLGSLEWMEVETGKQTPVEIKTHHTQEELLKLHTDLANQHRELEARVNYFKAKVKNLVSIKNADISKANSIEQQRVSDINSKLQEEWSQKYREYREAETKLHHEFENKRNLDVKELASLRIFIPERFQSTLDKYLVKEQE